MFARADGAVAAPTAGLHFTPALLAALAARGVAHATVTLHVGAGTFLPVRVEDLSHTPHARRTRRRLRPKPPMPSRRHAPPAGGSLRSAPPACALLETAARTARQPFAGETDLFILPGYRFRTVDVLLTNFHLPRSTLFMLVCAFAGTARMRAAYAHAIAAGYRFYSYGDACLLERAA